jgi:SAM-dependent methyltransferase
VCESRYKRQAMQLVSRLGQVLRDRRNKRAMSEASYWDQRAQSRSGFARSVWHSETYSLIWDQRQQQLLRQTLRDQLGTLRDQTIADVGCGTGRITRFLAREGAQAIGIDFSPKTIDAAREETEQLQLHAKYVVADISQGALGLEDNTCDAALAVGCLAVACPSLPVLEQAFVAIRKALKPGGTAILLEPIHQNLLLKRVLQASVEDWIACANRAGLRLIARRSMGFVPIRLAFSSFDAPSTIVNPVFKTGEMLLDLFPQMAWTGDYQLLEFKPNT